MPKGTARARAQARPKKGGVVLAGIPRVNLLPPNEVDRRATVSLVKRWLVGLLATAAVVSSVVAGAHWVRTTAAAELAVEQHRTLSLNAELAGFAEVSRSLAEQAALTNFRAEAMGNDTEWRRFFKVLLAAVPKGAVIRDFNLIAGANPIDGTDPGAAIGLIGRVTLATEEPQDLARLVRDLRHLDIALSADASSLTTAGEAGYTFTVDFVINQALYSGAFNPNGGVQ